MVQLPPLSEGAFSQVRAALNDRAATMERRKRVAEIRMEVDPRAADELDNVTTALFWCNDAILTVENAEPFLEPDPAQMSWTSA